MIFDRRLHVIGAIILLAALLAIGAISLASCASTRATGGAKGDGSYYIVSTVNSPNGDLVCVSTKDTRGGIWCEDAK